MLWMFCILLSFPFSVEKNVSYESLVRDFMAEEARYLRDLNLIIKLVRRNFISHPKLFTEKVQILFPLHKERKHIC